MKSLYKNHSVYFSKNKILMSLVTILFFEIAVIFIIWEKDLFSFTLGKKLLTKTIGKTNNIPRETLAIFL